MNLLIFTLKLFLETSYVFLCFFQLLSQFPTRRKKYTNLNNWDRRCDQWHHGKQNRVARASEYFPPSGRKMFTHLLYSFLSLLLDLYELKAEPMFSFCWVISEQSLRALKYKSLWTVFSCEWSVPDCDITKESQARARFDKPIRFNFRHCHLSASEFMITAIYFF